MAKFRTSQTGLAELRSAFTGGASAETALTATGRLNTNIPSHAFPLSDGMNEIEITFASNAVNQNAVANIYVARSDGDIVLLGTTGTLTSGAQTNTDGKFIVDTLASITSYWPESVTITDGGAGDRVTRINLDIIGYKTIFVLYTTITQNHIWTAYISGY